ncbi:hypothetical protein RSC2_00971 [Bacillus paralicheniformis]|nr:hypothetical protein RSC2_00971 [Bacillus paralicheniformis]
MNMFERVDDLNNSRQQALLGAGRNGSTGRSKKASSPPERESIFCLMRERSLS